MVEDMNECGAALNSTLQNCKQMTTDARALATSLAKVYQKAIDEPWRGASNELSQTQSSEAYKDAWDTINNSYRSTTQAVVLEQALEPLRKAVTSFTPEFEELKAQRAAALLDFDANRRRLSDLEQQKALAEAKNKNHGDAAIALDQKIDKYQSKKAATGSAYDKLNEAAKDFCLGSKLKHDELVDSVIISVAVCQAELFRRAADELDKVCDTMPQERVHDLRKRVLELLKAGGTIVPEAPKTTKRPSLIQSIGGLFGGAKETPLTPAANGKGPAPLEASAPPALAAPVPVAAAASNRAPAFTASPTAAQLPRTAPAAPSAPPLPAAAKHPIVTALYDNEIDADDELPFSKGDKVEVLKTEEGGWWYGRCNGREGLFPVDYVNISEM